MRSIIILIAPWFYAVTTKINCEIRFLVLNYKCFTNFQICGSIVVLLYEVFNQKWIYS